MKTNTAIRTIIALGLAVSSAASVAAQSWGDGQACGTRESASTAALYPSRFALDGRANTEWRLASGSSSGWMEAYTSTPRRLGGAIVSAYLPQGVTLSIRTLRNDAWYLVPGGIITGPVDSTTRLAFPGELPPASRVLVELNGIEADKARVSEIAWVDGRAEAPFKRILPKSYSTSFDEYINIKADRLWDGINGNAWFEPIWSPSWLLPHAPDSTQGPAIFPPYRGYPPSAGSIEWTLDGPHEIQVLKAYAIKPQRSLRFEFMVGGLWSNPQEIRTQWTLGWQRVELAKPVTADKIRITFPDGWDGARYLGEIEVWGKGFDDIGSRVLVMSAHDSSGYSHATIDALAQGDYSIEAVVQGTIAAPIEGQWNGRSISLVPIASISGTTLLKGEVAKESLRNGTQFLKLRLPADLSSLCLAPTDRSGRFDLGSPWCDGFFDQSASSTPNTPISQKRWELGGTYQLERLRIYSPSAGTPSFKASLGRASIPIAWTSTGSGYWEAELHGLIANALNFSSLSPMALDEVLLYGTPVFDGKIGVELWWPRIGADGEPATGGADDSLIGWTGDPSARVSIESLPALQSDSLFSMPLGLMVLMPGLEDGLMIQGTMGPLSTTLKTRIDPPRHTAAELDQGQQLLSTTGDAITLSGTVDDPWARVFINGQETTVSKKAFSKSVALAEGFQILEVQVWDRFKSRMIASFIKPVYRAFGSLMLDLDLPRGDLLTQSDSIVLAGRAGNGMDLRLSIQGQAAALASNAYEKTVQLSQGTNTLTFSLTDGLGRTATRTLSIVRDSQSPMIRILTPTEGQYLASGIVKLTFSSDDATPPWWKLDEGAWFAGSANPESLTLSLADGFYTKTMRAQDRTGNLSDPAQVNFVVDTLPPATFEIGANVSGWTSNTRPTLTFTTTDATSGVDRYEYAIDGGAASPAASPLVLPALADGVHTVAVFAFDKAGNVRPASVSLWIDTSAPPMPISMKAIPGADSIGLSWTGVDDGESFQTYRIEREIAWSDGTRAVAVSNYGPQTYIDVGLEPGAVYSYRAWAVDRAGNASPKTPWVTVQVGMASSPVNPAKPTDIQYYKVSAEVPAGALAPDVESVLLAEVLEDGWVKPTPYALASRIYEFMVSRVENGVSEISTEALLSSPATVRIQYDQDAIPAGLGPSNLKPYYYDIIWGQWVPVPGAVVNTSSRTVIFKASHFTAYCVLADQGMSLDASQAKDAVVSPFSTATGHGPVAASTEGGTVSTSFTEAVLPGKNNFDLALCRTYSSGTAQADAPSVNIGAGTSIPKPVDDRGIDGDSPWNMGQGWRLSFPYMKWNGSGLYVNDADGRTISLGQMKEGPSTESAGVQSITYENHEGSDGTFVARFKLGSKDIEFLFFKIGTRTTYSFIGASYYMKDGRVVEYDDSGRVIRLLDSSQKNLITFSYSGSHASTITDSMGRAINISYGGDRISGLAISTGSEALTTSYAYNGDGELTSATDIGGRTWSYSYQGKYLSSGSTLLNPPSGYQNAGPSWVRISALSSLSGPGIGTSYVTYDTKPFSYQDTVIDEGQSWTFQISYERLLASSIVTTPAASQTALRQTTYKYEITNNDPVKNQYYTSKSVVDDGRMVRTTTYSPKLMTRTALSSAPEAFRKSVDFTIGTRDEPDEVVTINPLSVLAISGSGEVERHEQKWDETYLRVLSDSVKRADDNKREEAFEYDSWGNVKKKIETEVVGMRATSRTSEMTYYNTGASSLKLNNTPGTLNLTELTPLGSYANIRSLLAEMKTVSTVIDSSSGITSNDPALFVAYTYNGIGQVTAKKAWNGTAWTSTTYDSYDPDNGQLTEMTGPTDQKTIFQYQYVSSQPAEFRITTTLKDVAQADGSTRDIVTQQGFDLHKGNNIWSIDARGFVTQREFDNLGRMTKIVEPMDTDTPQAPLAETETLSRNAQGHPTTSLVYDDAALKSTVTTPLGAVIVYQFDPLGRLSTTTKSMAQPVQEVLTTQMSYDGYDQLTSIVGPWSSLETARPETKYTYDARGRIASVRAPGAMAARTSSYNDASNTATSVDEMGNTTVQVLDWSGRAITSTRKLSTGDITTRAFYDGSGRPVASINGNGNLSTISYNEYGLKSIVRGQPRDVSGAIVTPELRLYYDEKGSLQKAAQALDSDGARTTEYQTNGIGQFLSSNSDVTVDGSNKTIVITNSYDKSGNLLSQESGYEGGAKTKKSWTYDSHSRVLTQTDEDNNTTAYTYDAAGNRTSVTDPRQAKTVAKGGTYTGDFAIELRYDQLGRLYEADLPRQAGGQDSTLAFVYDGRGNLIRKVEADGGISLYEYTIRGLLRKQTITDGTTSYSTTHTYDDAGRLWTSTSPSGRTDTTTYDEASRVTSQGNDVVGYDRATYDGNGNVLTVSDGEGHTTTYTYTPDNLVATVTDAKLNVSKNEYDRWGQLTKTVDTEKNERRYRYDELGRLVAESTPWYAGSDYNLKYTYDAWGNVTSQTDARGTSFVRTYTKTNRLWTETATNGSWTETATNRSRTETAAFTYDEAGDLRTSDNGVLTQYNLVNGAYQPDPYGLTTGKTDLYSGASVAMGYTYDQKQRLTGMSYPDASTLSYVYNQLDQLTAMPGWITGSPTYDAYGRLESFTLANGTTKTIAYDSQDRLYRMSYSSAGTEVVARYELGYDKASNIVSKNGNGYGYDKLNQLISSSETGWFQKKPEDLQAKMKYGLADRDYRGTKVMSFTVPATTTVALDCASRSVGVDLGAPYGVNKIELHPSVPSKRVKAEDIAVYASLDNATTTDPETADYTKVTGWSLVKDTETGTLTLSFPRIFEARYLKITTIWDDRNLDNESIYTEAQFTHTATELVKVWTLVKSRTEAYEYDSIGNRTKLRVTDPDGQVTDTSYEYYKNSSGGNLSWVKYDGQWYYQYDQAGNRTVKAKALVNGQPDVSQEYWTYTWDLHNRLIEVRKLGVPDSRKIQVSYTYDAENFRMRREGKDGTTVYAYDLMGSLTYQKNVTSGFERSIAYLGSDVVGWTEKQGGTTTKYYAATDHLGSVTKVLDKDAKVVWESEYTAFGTAASPQGSLSFSGMYAGKDIDPDTGLTYHWNRWRSEDGSRFISEDPIRDGINYYGYAGNSPICFTDPFGLDAIDFYNSLSHGGDTSWKAYDTAVNGGSSGSGGPSEPSRGDTAVERPIIGYYTDYVWNENTRKMESFQVPCYGDVPIFQPKAEKPAEKLGASTDAGGNASGSSGGSASGGSTSGGGASGGESNPDPSDGNGSSSEVTSGGNVSIASQGDRNLTTPSEDFLKKFIKQNYIQDTGPNGVGPCYYRSLQAAAEVYAGRSLSLQQINDATSHLRKQKNEWGQPVLYKDWRIGGGNGRVTIITDALQRMGITNVKVGVYDQKTEGAQFTIRAWDGRHYQLGDANGNLLWEPYEFKGTSPYTGEPDSLIYISIGIE